MPKKKNILFIMFDQLRWDYLSCYGHATLETPHIDRLAAKGVRFNRAYVQSPICGASRMSTYTGRYVQSHGASWNNVPLKVGELTMGDHLRAVGTSCWLVGKTHMKADAAGMARLGLEPESIIGARLAECGFDVFERDDGMRPEGPNGFYDEKAALKYNDYLRSKGYNSDNPWHDFANSGIDEDGNVLSGWFLGNSDLAANIIEEDSETPYLTRRGMEFIEQADTPWLCHLSYIKPHWPYIVPEPYASMYGPSDIQPPVRSQAEYDNAHPIHRRFMDNPLGRAFSCDEVREKVIPAYMGLIKQCDDQMGVLFDWLEATGRMQDTIIALTSDHGDFLGDHWMGEKMFFQDASTRVPLIIFDPSEEADATRGSVSDALVESIDLLPTFLDYSGGEALPHILEGHSLRPFINGTAAGEVRDIAVCEYDYSATPLAGILDIDVRDARIFMVATKQWKLIHFEGGFDPMLFDLLNDPDELTDLGTSELHAGTLTMMYQHLAVWARRASQRTTVSAEQLAAMRGKSRAQGVFIGVVSSDDVSDDIAQKYINRMADNHKDPGS
ncbi:phosphonate monoester hydrolase [Chromatiales bacterium (ex Bugula neritina AB1)]|nr:phosphonate monoester hydrolase [Chromatiales bacterium (ex Bugula neritina AB1)]